MPYGFPAMEQERCPLRSLLWFKMNVKEQIFIGLLLKAELKILGS